MDEPDNRTRVAPSGRATIAGPVALAVNAGRGRRAMHMAPNYISCPLCTAHFSSNDSALFCHISMGPTDVLIDDAVRQTLHELERKVCATENCGALRCPGQLVCQRCRCSARLRPLAVMDRVPALMRREGPGDDGTTNSQHIKDRRPSGSLCQP